MERISRLDSRLTGRSRASFRDRVRALRDDRDGLDAMLDAVERRLGQLPAPQPPAAASDAPQVSPEDASRAFLARHGLSEDEWWVQYAEEIGAHPPWVGSARAVIRCRDCRHVVLNEPSPNVGVCGCRIGHPGEFARKRHTCTDFARASGGTEDIGETGHSARPKVPMIDVRRQAA